MSNFTPPCAICSNAVENSRFLAREMMFGFRDEFRYFECGNCGCVQIEKVPADLSRFYPDDYYSFTGMVTESRVKRYFIGRRAAHLRGDHNIVGGFYNYLRPAPAVPEVLARAQVDFRDAILEIGSGLGHRLVNLSYSGFCNLIGIDPFLKCDVHYKNGVTILKQTIEQTEGVYDFVVLHHALEHMPDQLNVLRHVHRLLKPRKLVLIRIPVAGSYAWRKYREHWVQLDAPRHLFLHTSKSLALLADRAGFSVEKIIYDSTGFQFWGSEQYQRGIPLVQNAVLEPQPKPGLFSDTELARFETQAEELNQIGEADQACFYLRRM